MKKKTMFLLSSIILVVGAETAIAQISKEDAASWGLKVASDVLARSGKSGLSSAAYGLSQLFEVSSNRSFQKDLARINSMPNGVYIVNNGNVGTIPDGYYQKAGKWYDVNTISEGSLCIKVDGTIVEVPANQILFPHPDGQWYCISNDDLKNNLKLFDQNGYMCETEECAKRTLQILFKPIFSNGWYHFENGENTEYLSTLPDVTNLNYKYNPQVPYGITFYNTWTDTNNDILMQTEELTGINKSIYNLAQERLSVLFNVPIISKNIVWSVYKSERLLGTTIMTQDYFVFARFCGGGEISNPAKQLDCLDRMELDARETGGGVYRLVIACTDHQFAFWEKSINVSSK